MAQERTQHLNATSYIWDVVKELAKGAQHLAESKNVATKIWPFSNLIQHHSICCYRVAKRPRNNIATCSVEMMRAFKTLTKCKQLSITKENRSFSTNALSFSLKLLIKKNYLFVCNIRLINYLLKATKHREFIKAWLF